MLLLLPLSSLAQSLPIEESEKTREEVKEVRGTMWIESILSQEVRCVPANRHVVVRKRGRQSNGVRQLC